MAGEDSVAGIVRRLNVGRLDQPPAELVTVPAGELRALIEAARHGEEALWRHNHGVPEIKTRREGVAAALKVKLAAMTARGETPSLRGRGWPESSALRDALADRLAESLDQEFVFAPRPERTVG